MGARISPTSTESEFFNRIGRVETVVTGPYLPYWRIDGIVMP